MRDTNGVGSASHSTALTLDSSRSAAAVVGIVEEAWPLLKEEQQDASHENCRRLALVEMWCQNITRVLGG